MATKLGEMKHPKKDKTVTVYKGYAWPCLILGPFWYLFHGFLLSFLFFTLAVCITFGVAWLILPCGCHPALRDRYRRRGYTGLNGLEIGKGGKVLQTTESAVDAVMGEGFMDDFMRKAEQFEKSEQRKQAEQQKQRRVPQPGTVAVVVKNGQAYLRPTSGGSFPDGRMAIAIGIPNIVSAVVQGDTVHVTQGNGSVTIWGLDGTFKQTVA